MSDELEPSAHEPAKLLARPIMKVKVAATGALILLIGAWLAPRAAQTTVSTSEELAAPLLEEQVLAREVVVQPFTGVADVVATVRGHNVAILRSGGAAPATLSDFMQPAPEATVGGFGAFVSDTHVLTHANALEGRTMVQIRLADNRQLDARLAAYDPSSGMVLLQTQPSGATPAALAPQRPAVGTLAVAVGPTDGSDLAAPMFLNSVAPDHYTLGGSESVLAGMPVYTQSGDLIAIAEGGGRRVAFPAWTAASQLIAKATAGEQLASVGVVLQTLVEPISAVYGEQGALVCDVVEGGPADAAGIQAGDVLLLVGESEVDSPEAATRLLSSAAVGEATALRVRRAGRERTFEVTPALAFAVAALAQTRVDSDAATSRPASQVLPEDVVARSGIPPNARVVSLNGRSVTSAAQAQRALNTRQALPVLLRLGARQFFAAIEPVP
jgi:S1-C subfamily serine protease